MCLYGPEYYNSHCGLPYDRSQPSWLNFFGSVAEEIVSGIRPKRVLDVGCAKGFLVEALRDRGVEAYGFDVSEYAIREIRSDIRNYCWVASVAEPFRDHYDLITCIEVLEHVGDAEARIAVESMSHCTENILFSSSPADFNEPTHVNVHPVLDWLELFCEFQFSPDAEFDASFLSPQAVLLRRSEKRASGSLLRTVASNRNKAIANEVLQRKVQAFYQDSQGTQQQLTTALQDLEVSTQKLVAATQQWEGARQQLLEEESTKQQMRDHVAHVESTNQRLRDHIAHVESTNQRLRDHIAHVERSLAWQMTAKFRMHRDRIAPPATWRARFAMAVLHIIRKYCLR